MTPTNHFAASLVPFGVAVAVVLNGDSVLPAQPGYQMPPQAILDVLHAPRLPEALASPTGDRILLFEKERYPPLAELAAPYLKLGGLRIDPLTNGPHAAPRVVGLAMTPVAGARRQEVVVALPKNARLSVPLWSPDGQRFAFTRTTATGIELWVGLATSAQASLIPDLRINAAFGIPMQWRADGKTLLCQTVPAGRGKPPQAPHVPTGPTIQVSSGKPAPVRTFQDLLQNSHDEALFDYYATSQLVVVDPEANKVRAVGRPAIFRSAAASPDGRFLLVSILRRPYSYLVPATAFAQDIEVWDQQGKVVHQVARRPLGEQVPIEGVPTGPRQVQWRPTAPATLAWAEALDGGDPRTKVEQRDRLMLQPGPFREEPREWLRTRARFTAITWTDQGSLAFVQDCDRDKRWRRTFLHDADRPKEPGRLVWSLSVHDRYHDPGELVLRSPPPGRRVCRVCDGNVFLIGKGATAKGERPFLDRMSLESLKTERLFRGAEGCYENALAVLADDGSRFLTRHESPADAPNYFVHAAGGQKRPLKHMADPTPQLRAITRQLVTYKREDGVPLSFTLYLPPGYNKGERLPALLWAYPREFVDAGTAGQVSGSPYHYPTFIGPSHLFLLLCGYALIDGAAMPVVGDPETVNNTYIQQIVDSARAAIRKADEMGAIDPGRVAVGGHSYGAFMTANLLAHCNLFKAGIARSGAYNRTLTPFGFQSERRTLWEAPDLYFKVSPLLHADKIKAPLLLIHGQADNNEGTFPIQSERLYHAIKGNGGTARFVSLPHEAHGYLARESVEHTLYEMIAWLDRYLK